MPRTRYAISTSYVVKGASPFSSILGEVAGNSSCTHGHGSPVAGSVPSFR